MKKFFVSFWKTIFCTLVILYLSISKGESLPEVDIPNIDKVVHFLMYFGLTLAVLHDFQHSSKIHLKHWQIIALSIIVVIGWGGFLEILQRIPGLHRSSNFFDFIANTIGAVAGAISYKKFEPILNKINGWFIMQ